MKSLQEKILDSIMDRYVKKADGVNALAEILGVGIDPIYRRLRGDTLLTADEVQLLVRKYNISLDAMIYQEKDAIVFSYNSFTQPVKTFEEYIQQFVENARLTAKLPNVHVYYAAADFPIFYYTFFPELFMFKLFTWGKTVWNFEYLRNLPFSFDIVSPHAMDMMKEVTNIYIGLEITELWNLNIVGNTLGQIEHHFNNGDFKNPEDALFLLQRLSDLMLHIKKMAAEGQKLSLSGNKTHEAPFHLYHNEMVITDNIIFMTSKAGKVLFSTLSYPNFIRSTDKQICEHQHEWFNMIIKKSTPIDLEHAEDREWFFSRVNTKIEMTRKRLELRLLEMKG